MTSKSTPLRRAAVAVAVLATVAGCAYPGQSQYESYNVGHPIPVQFGSIVASRPIAIKGQPTGLGAASGAAAGAIGGSTLGQGSGSAAAALGLALVGLAAGAIFEQSLIDHPGVEYTVVLQSGQTFTIAQNLNPDDRILQPGERVMVQQGYGYMRVLPAENIPADVQRPTGLTVH